MSASYLCGLLNDWMDLESKPSIGRHGATFPERCVPIPFTHGIFGVNFMYVCDSYRNDGKFAIFG